MRPRTRLELCELMDISISTFRRWLQAEGITLKRTLVSIRDQKMILTAFGMEDLIGQL